MTCSACNTQMNPGARFCSNCGSPLFAQSVPPVYPPVYPRLVRPRYGRVFGGVCAGFAQTYGWDVVLVRIVLSALVFFGCGTPILAYFVAWMVMPNEPYFIPTPPPPPTSAQPVA